MALLTPYKKVWAIALKKDKKQVVSNLFKTKAEAARRLEFIREFSTPDVISGYIVNYYYVSLERYSEI